MELQLITIKKFWAFSMKAGVLLIPYLIWVTFAGYLNISICLLNK
ncbi:tryptophan-rich sensory protein [Oscillibacter ruminantium]